MRDNTHNYKMSESGIQLETYPGSSHQLSYRRIDHLKDTKMPGISVGREKGFPTTKVNGKARPSSLYGGKYGGGRLRRIAKPSRGLSVAMAGSNLTMYWLQARINLH